MVHRKNSRYGSYRRWEIYARAGSDGWETNYAPCHWLKLVMWAACGAIRASSSAGRRMYLWYAMLATCQDFIVISGTVAALAVVLAPIWKLWTLKEAPGTLAAERACCTLATNHLRQSGVPSWQMKRGPGAPPQASRQFNSEATGHNMVAMALFQTLISNIYIYKSFASVLYNIIKSKCMLTPAPTKMERQTFTTRTETLYYNTYIHMYSSEQVI